ncbi:MAG: flagellar hook-basal body complex protein FliE [Alphaproteobacteria bacterium]
MSVSVANALSAYVEAARRDSAGMEPREGPAGSGFADLLKSVAGDVVETGRNAERVTAAAVEGKADIAEVVTAVTNAELTLQTVVAVRDRVIEAYQEILRMPI